MYYNIAVSGSIFRKSFLSDLFPDTYILMDNLHDFLQGYNHSAKHFLGRRFVVPEDNATFYSGGPGTIISQRALRELGMQISLLKWQL